MFVYIISDYTRKNIHVGYCTDIVKTVEEYNMINDVSLLWPLDKYLNRLVYLEEVPDEFWAKDRIKALVILTNREKEEMILESNPAWMDLTTADNFQF